MQIFKSNWSSSYFHCTRVPAGPAALVKSGVRGTRAAPRTLPAPPVVRPYSPESARFRGNSGNSGDQRPVRDFRSIFDIVERSSRRSTVTNTLCDDPAELDSLHDLPWSMIMIMRESFAKGKTSEDDFFGKGAIHHWEFLEKRSHAGEKNRKRRVVPRFRLYS